ncbi:MAG: transglutaminase domain-containing protein [Deltaproteobacteria bacterium]|nr:transglutaminase domain-containing protein [Deltaproteobacteria bacterium]
MSRCKLVLLILAGWVPAASAAGLSFDAPTSLQLEYLVEIKPTAVKGEIMKLWVPYPLENSFQKVVHFSANSPWPYQVTSESKFGNKMLYFSGKVPETPLTLRFKYHVIRQPYRGLKKEEIGKFDQPSLYLSEDKLIPFCPEIVKLSRQEGKGGETPYEKIKAFYRYIVRTMKYDKSGEGWGRGDAVWACSTKRGNCTDFHSLFIAMSRVQKIAARFEIGFPIPSDQEKGEIAGYHCWAEAYDPVQGWIPVDATEAKKSGKVDEYFGALPSNRISFSRGRDIVLNPPQKGESLNYFVYPYAEVGGKPYPNVDKKLFFKVLKLSAKPESLKNID